ncbi:GNAT family N-acetyltransferase [Sphingomonas immobilis]|uniref:GNAT family N-acetyltransferase n=1 Tax=Sphingomonas immobilis TaxID=3063997 RepID=A0ABT8ZYK0_9SPHN|nr:GNAT family N-acetyltransferase [Sphingomonas sp. CA1-15]MDO7842649.1 GNAT family N-acetyltransferase [Sphingomonas sp. CA1-15]
MRLTTSRLAVAADLERLHPVIERAYRGDSARAGWTHEADIIAEGTRTDMATLEGILADPTTRLIVALHGDTPIGCVQVSDKGSGIAYLGLLCIDPLLQAGGLGRQLITAAEDLARDSFAAMGIEMTVIEQRAELIAYYERRGYAQTGERRDFPIPLDPPLFMTVLAKRLAQPSPLR